MAKKNFSADAEDAFEMLTARSPVAPKKESAKQSKPEIKTKPKRTSKLKAKEMGELKQTAFYITPDQHKAIKLRAITSSKPEEKDASAIIRLAIDAYLKN